MPFKTTRWETGKLMSGDAEGITRMYPDGECPHIVGGKTFLTTDFATSAEGTDPYAVGVIKSIRPCTVGERKRDKRLAKMDGFPDAIQWYGHFCRMYGEQKDDVVIHRLQFNIEEMEKI